MNRVCRTRPCRNALIPDKPVLALLGLEEDGQVQLTIQDGNPIITPRQSRCLRGKQRAPSASPATHAGEASVSPITQKQGIAEMVQRILISDETSTAFSPVTMSDGTRDWYGLGPVTVHPDFQGQGIGKALIQEGLSRLKNLEAKGCCLVGHPQYYRQFGFENVEGLVHEGVPRDVFFVFSFDGTIPQGKVLFQGGFKANG